MKRPIFRHIPRDMSIACTYASSSGESTDLRNLSLIIIFLQVSRLIIVPDAKRRPFQEPPLLPVKAISSACHLRKQRNETSKWGNEGFFITPFTTPSLDLSPFRPPSDTYWLNHAILSQCS